MRLIVGLTVLLLAEIGLRAMDGATSPLPTKMPERSLEAIPEELEGWTARELPLDPAIFKNSGAAAMVNRVYKNTIGDEIAANIGIWLNQQVGLPHPPELCYPGAGWEIVNRQQCGIPLENGEGAGRILTLQKGSAQIRVLYWFHCGDHIVLDNGELRPIRQASRGHNRSMPRLVKVMLQSGHPDAAIAKQQLVALATQLIPESAKFAQ